MTNVQSPARKRRTLTQRDARLGLALISPTLLIVLAIVVFPLLWSILISFQRLRLIEIGRADFFRPLSLTNFERVIGSGALWTSLGTTLVYTIGSVVLSISLGLLAAMAVRKPFRGRTFVRAAFLLPYVAPVVAVTFIWRTMLNPQFGIVNAFGQNVLGWDAPIAFVSTQTSNWNGIPVPTALLTAIAFEAWRYFPFAFLFIMARLGALSGEAEEAALVDGATPWQSFRFVVLPQLMPIIGLLAILRTIWTFNEFDDIFLLTGGAAGTGVASVQIYNFLTVQRNVGAAAAQSIVMSVVLIVLLLVYLLILRRRGEGMTTELAATTTETAAAPAPVRRPGSRGLTRHNVQSRVFGVLRWVVIAILLIVTLLPFYYMILLSLKPIESLLRNPASLVVSPGEFTLSTYADVLASTASGGQGFGGLLANSLFVSLASVALALLIGIPGAYAIARLPFFGRRKISGLFLAAYLFPAILMAIPLFVLFTRIGLRGTLIGLVLVYTAQTVPVAIYMLRNYFETIPESVEEAGLVDGLTRIGVLRKLSLPLALPSIMSTGLFVFMIAWNEFLFALLFLVDKRDRWTVSLGLSQLSGSVEVPTTVLMAGSVVLTLPIIIIFFATERLLTGGLTAGAEKGKFASVMAYLVELTEPRSVGIRPFDTPAPGPDEVVVRTWYSGISAGTELGMYRGTNPYLDRKWDPEMALFLSGGATFAYPLDVWGYSEVGVIDAAGDGVTTLAPGDVVWGMWGHRSHAVLAAERLDGHKLPPGLNPMVGTFDRVGAVALNAVLAAGAFLGETVVVFGQGVIGLLTTQLLVSQGFHVLAVDTLPARLAVAERFGAIPVPADGDVALTVWRETDGRGADRVIELTGAYTALHEAIRCAGVDGTVVAAGFYQGPATALRLGEEFHHNRVRLVPSQIGAVPTVLRRRWTRQRLDATVMSLCARGRLDPMPLVTHVLPADRAAEAYALLDDPSPDLLQVLLDFRPDHA